MGQIKNFIDKYLSTYLKQSRSKMVGQPHRPPTDGELESLITYLQEKGLDPIIVGSIALIKHLKPTFKEIEDGSVRLTQDIDLFVSAALPNPPMGWRHDMGSIGVQSWIAPSGGYVDFLVAGHSFPDSTKNPKKIDKDAESEKMGCPVADIVSLYVLKLNSFREKDLLDLIALARKVGIPKELSQRPLNNTQKDNLSILKLWLSHDRVNKSPSANE